MNPTFDPTTLIDAFQSIVLQHRDQQRANHQLYHLVATMSEKVDDLSMKNTEPSENEEGEKNVGGNVTTCDKRESTNEEDSSDGDEIGEQRFVDHTFYRHMIGEGFSQRQPSDLAPSKPAYFNIDDQVARSLADSKFAAKRQEYSIAVANAFFASVTHEA